MLPHGHGLCAGRLGQVGLEGPNLQTLPEKGVLKHFRGVGSGVTARISQLTVLNHSHPGTGREWGVLMVPQTSTLPVDFPGAKFDIGLGRG